MDEYFRYSFLKLRRDSRMTPGFRPILLSLFFTARRRRCIKRHATALSPCSIPVMTVRGVANVRSHGVLFVTKRQRRACPIVQNDVGDSAHVVAFSPRNRPIATKRHRDCSRVMRRRMTRVVSCVEIVGKKSIGCSSFDSATLFEDSIRVCPSTE
jgi:hypothetical protein